MICEGPHDAQFVGRLLQESGQYNVYKEQLKNYPFPLGDFFTNKFQTRSVGELRLGKPDFPLVPIGAYVNAANTGLVFPISLGGMDKTDDALALIKNIEESLPLDALEVGHSPIEAYSILFLYDADSRGVGGTINLFVERFAQHYPRLSDAVGSSWTQQRHHLLSLFVFTDGSGSTGVLEDLLLELFRKKASHLADTEKHFETHFEVCSAEADAIAHASKKAKGILTACGQLEKSNAGSSLTVVIRDTALLDGVFDFSDSKTQWYRLLQKINGAFT